MWSILGLLVLLPFIVDALREARRGRDIMVLSKQVDTLSELGKLQEAIDACDELVRRCGDAAATEVRQVAVRMLTNKCMLLVMLRRGEDAFAAFKKSSVGLAMRPKS